MEHILLGVIAMGLLAVLVLVIYLVDRVNALERLAQSNPTLAPAGGPAKIDAEASGPFAGLEGRPLWEVLTGFAPGAPDPNAPTAPPPSLSTVPGVHPPRPCLREAGGGRGVTSLGACS